MQNFEPSLQPPPGNFLQKLGRILTHSVHSTGVGLSILFETLTFFHHIPRRRHEIIRQMFNAGIKTFFITSTVALFTGMILCLQTGLALAQYNQEVNVGTVVAQTMCREMGPFMTALILAASVGSAYAAEMGTMTVSEEISALQVMGINPADFLVMPRLIAMVVMTPILTIYTDVVGIIGGMLIAKTQLDVSYSAYYQNSINLLENKSIYVGLLKSIIFAVIIVTISCYKGFRTQNGAVGVGKATRQSVVVNFIYVLITGYFITRLFY